MRRVRYRFHGLYTDYGCLLLTIVIVQALSLAIGLTISLLTAYDLRFDIFWSTNIKREAAYKLINVTFTFYVPILTQLSSLIFGYIRYKKDKEALQVSSHNKDQQEEPVNLIESHALNSDDECEGEGDIDKNRNDST